MAKERFTTPVMRFVQGSVDDAQTKDAQGNLRVVKSGPNAGQPNPQYFVAGAIAKNDPAWPEFWGILCRAAALGFPNLFPNAAAGDYTCVHPQFAFKVIDGDGFDTSGKPNSGKEGFAGHWVVRFASAYPPRCFHAGRYAAHEQIQEKGAIKRGYYIRTSGTVEGNANAQRPGLYVNLDMVELSAYGPEIVSGPDASDAFGGGPAALPPGATAAPATPPTTPGFTPPPLAAPGAGASPAAALPVPGAPAPSAPAAPYTGYMQPPAAPAAGPTPPIGGAPAANPAPAAPMPPTSTTAYPGSGPVMLPAANGATYEQMIAAGWTDDTLRAHGMMA